MAPDGQTVHTARMPFFAERFEMPFDAMESHLPRVIDEVNSGRAGCDRLRLHRKLGQGQSTRL